MSTGAPTQAGPTQAPAPDVKAKEAIPEVAELGEAGLAAIGFGPQLDPQVAALRPGMVLALQRQAGNAAVSSYLSGRMSGISRLLTQRGIPVQRQPPTVTAPPAPGSSVNDPLLDPKEQQKLDNDEREYRAISTIRGSAEVWLENPVMVQAGTKEKRVESFTVQSVLARSVDPKQRKSFDSEGAALAFAIAMSGGQGGAVMKGDGVDRAAPIYFAATGGGAGSLTRDKVFQVRVQGPVTRIVGIDGFSFLPGTIYQPDAGKAAQTLDTNQTGMAPAASAADLAKMAGIQRPGEPQTPGGPDTKPFEIPDAQVRTFLKQYMIGRAVEVLDANAVHARKEMEEFKGAKIGEPNSKAIPDSAKKKIDKAREVGKKFSKLIEQEIYLEDLEARVGRAKSTGSGSSVTLVELDGKRLKITTWAKRIKDSRQIIASGKSQILSQNPLIAQLVDPRIGREEWAMQARELVKIANPFVGEGLVKGWDRATGTDNPFTRSELAKPSSPESDQKAREDYLKKLDAVLIAIAKVKAQVLAGDERYLFSLPGLGQRVRAELKTIGGKNAKLGASLDKIFADLGMSAADIAATVVEVAGIVLQLAGFFFPPLLFIGAVMSFGATAYNMDKALAKLEVSQAAVTPDEALVDPTEAQNEMIDRTIQLAMDAINVGMEVNAALDALELGRTKDLEKLASKSGEAKPKDVPEPKPGEPPKGTDPVPDPRATGSGAAGTVDPRMTTKTGLAGPDAIRKHTEAMGKLAEEWATKSPVDRAFMLQGRAQAAAADAGVPHKIIVTPDSSLKGYKMKFNSETMSVKVGHEVLNNPTADIAAIGELIYHETRHAEQYWQMARMRAAMGEDAQTIAKNMNIPLELADKAVANKLATGTEEYRAAFQWYDSIFGAGRVRRTELLKKGGLLDTAEEALITAKKDYDALNASKKATAADVQDAHARWQQTYNDWKALDREYRMLPEEQDAYLVGGRARRQFDITDPATAPPTNPAPSVPPPDTTPSPAPVQPLRVQRRARNGTGAAPLRSVVAMARAMPANGHASPVHVQRDDKTPTNLDEALRTGDSDEVRKFRPFKGITDNQLLSLNNLLVAQGWVGPRDETMLEEAWSSYGLRASLRESDAQMWNRAQDGGADPDNVQWLRDLRSQFRTDVRDEARHNLGENQKAIDAQMQKLGINPGADQAAADAAVKQLQDEAKIIERDKAALKGLSSLEVGYSEPLRPAATKQDTGGGSLPGGTDDEHQRKAERKRAMFSTDGPPPYRPEPDDHMAKWESVAAIHGALLKSVAERVAKNPILSALVTVESDDRKMPAATGALATPDQTPAQAREKIGAALTEISKNIEKTRKAVDDKELGFNTMIPVHEKFFATHKEWSKPFHRAVGRRAIADEGEDRAAGAALVGAATFALIVAVSILSAGTAVPVLIPALISLTASGAAAAESWGRWSTIETATKTAMTPGNALVLPQTAAEAEHDAMIDTAFALIDVFGAGKAAKAVKATASAARVAAFEAKLVAKRELADLGKKEISEQAKIVTRVVERDGALAAVEGTGRKAEDLATLVGRETAAGKKLASLAGLKQSAVDDLVTSLPRLAEKSAEEAKTLVSQSVEILGPAETLRRAGGWAALEKAVAQDAAVMGRLESFRTALITDVGEVIGNASGKEGVSAARQFMAVRSGLREDAVEIALGVAVMFLDAATAPEVNSTAVAAHGVTTIDLEQVAADFAASKGVTQPLPVQPLQRQRIIGPDSPPLPVTERRLDALPWDEFEEIMRAALRGGHWESEGLPRMSVLELVRNGSGNGLDGVGLRRNGNLVNLYKIEFKQVQAGSDFPPELANRAAGAQAGKPWTFDNVERLFASDDPVAFETMDILRQRLKRYFPNHKVDEMLLQAFQHALRDAPLIVGTRATASLEKLLPRLRAMATHLGRGNVYLLRARGR